MSYEISLSVSIHSSPALGLNHRRKKLKDDELLHMQEFSHCATQKGPQCHAGRLCFLVRFQVIWSWLELMRGGIERHSAQAKPNQIRRGRWGREGGRRGSDTITAERDLERAGGESSVTVRPCPPLAAIPIHPGGGWRGRRSPTWRATVACYAVAAISLFRNSFKA